MLASLCIFCAVTVEAFQFFLGEPSGWLALVAVVAGYLLCSSISLWIQADATQRRKNALYDFDSLTFFFWPIVAPIYLFRRRGWDAVAPIGLFLLLQIGGVLFAALLAYPHSMTYFSARVP
jgi:hypothetical protein